VIYTGLMPMPPAPPNESDLIIVAYNKDYIPAVLLALTTLEDPGQWLDPPDDLSNIIATLKTALITSID